MRTQRGLVIQVLNEKAHICLTEGEEFSFNDM